MTERRLRLVEMTVRALGRNDREDSGEADNKKKTKGPPKKAAPWELMCKCLLIRINWLKEENTKTVPKNVSLQTGI